MPTDERVVEGLTVGGERQHHRPCRGANAAQPHPTHLDEIFTGVAAASYQPAVGLRGDCLDIGLAHLPPARHGDTVSEVARQPRHALTGLGEEVEDPDLGKNVIVPGRLGADPAGEPAHTVGECCGTGVGESPGDLVPGREAGDARIGESAPETVFEPAIELDESSDEFLDALVARPFCGFAASCRRPPATVRCRHHRWLARRRPGHRPPPLAGRPLGAAGHRASGRRSAVR